MPALAHDESEYRTRRQRIDPMLEAQGWHVVPFDPARLLTEPSCTTTSGRRVTVSACW